jgi:hypothetical protein
MISLEIGLYLVAAAIVAAVIRLYDTPKTAIVVDGVIQWDVILPPIVGAALAVPIGCWVLNIDATVPTGFAEAVMLGIAGLSVVKAVLNIVTKEEE